jgi:bla regulator protein BlaR1
MNLDFASPALTAVLNHLWQSTLFAAVAGLLTLPLRRNRARTRYWLWVAASVKFLIPFSLLVDAGSHLGWRVAPIIVQSDHSSMMEQIFAAPALAIAAPATAQNTPSQLPALLFAAWLSGFWMVLFRWWREWRRIRTALRTASPFRLDAPIRAMSSPALLEPGVFGVLRPVLLLPEGIAERLMPEQLKAIIAHELCHVRYHDNLAAAFHMLAEAMFWFHPLVWWIGKRLVDERERGCDEDVLQLGTQPSVYAQGILKVCEFYLESPLACVAGIAGSSLRKRIQGIMLHRSAHQLDSARKLLLFISGAAAIAGPVAIGFLNAPQIHAQSQATASPAPAFEVASIKPGREKSRPTRRLNPTGIELTGFSLRMLISEAYNVIGFSVSNEDSRTRDLLDRGTFDIAAKADHEVAKEQLMRMLQTLLADRFKLTIHHESKTEPVYKLMVAANGPKLKKSVTEAQAFCALGAEGGVECHSMTMPVFSSYLTDRMGRVVLDLTGLKEAYDFTLELDGVPGLNQMRQAMATGTDPGEAKRALAASMRNWSSSSIFSDIQKQLGLKLEADKAPVDHLVIEHVEKPSEN